MKLKVADRVFTSVNALCKHYNLNQASFKRWIKRNPGKRQREMKVKLLIEFVEV